MSAMPCNVNSFNNLNDDENEVSIAEVPVQHFVNDEEEVINEAENENGAHDANYELLSQDVNDFEQRGQIFYQQHVLVNWIEANNDNDFNAALEEPGYTFDDSDSSEVSDFSDSDEDSRERHETSQESQARSEVREERVIEMDDSQVAKIKDAMSGFQLPKEHIPAWASNVSEEDWKQVLASKISAKK